MFIEKSFDTGTLTLNYAEGATNGEPLVALHGIPNRWQGMKMLLAPLASHWHVFACDMRGHGRSGRADSYRAVDYFADTATFVERCIGKPTVLIGHSGGAMAVLGAATMIPDHVRALVLLDPPFLPWTTRVWPKSTCDFMKGILATLQGQLPLRDLLTRVFPGIDERGIAWFKKTIEAADSEVIETLLAGHYFDGLDLAALLRQVSCPVLLLYGEVERGGLVGESDVEFFRAHARHGTAIQLEGASHFLHAEQPARVVELMVKWLDGLG